MKKQMKKTIAVLLSVLLCCSALTAMPVSAFAATTAEQTVGATSGTTGDCTWTLDEATGTLTISGNGAMAYYNDDNDAPWKNQYVKQVVIESGVTSIGKNAFCDCLELTSVTIPDSVTEIGANAFYGCSGLTSIAIPDSVTTIGESAFCGCTGLTNVTIPDSVTSIGGSAFFGCTGLTSVTIPDSVTSIGSDAFYGCESIISITVSPDNPVYNSQNNCNAIIETKTNTLIIGCKSTVIPDSVTSIGNSAFSYCTGLTSVTIPDSVTYIGENAFKGCKGLTILGYADSTAESYAKTNQIPFVSIAKWTYSKKTCTLSFSGTGTTGYDYPWKKYPVKEIIIEEGMTEIYAGAFEGLTDLTKITIPNGVNTIGENAFYGCEKLKTVTVPKSVTTIGEKAFGYYIGEYYNNDLDYGTKEMTVDGFNIIGIQDSEASSYAAKDALTFSPIKHGDLNCDGKVNGADAGLLNRYISGWEGYENKIKSMQCADINGDGKVQGNDAGLLNRYCSGWTGYDSYIVPIA